MSEPAAARLRAEGLTKSFVGRRVVDDVTIEVHAGEVVGLLGPNGAGKTTSFHMIVGLTRPDAGRVFLDGTDVTPLPMYERARRGIGYLPQEASVFRKLTVEDNILAILETLDLTAAERTERPGLVGRRAPPAGDHARARHFARVHAAGRAVRGDRSHRRG
jgi:lipopolysaccharide export system ATP-binding protein